MSKNIQPADGTDPAERPTRPYPGRAQIVALRAIHESGYVVSSTQAYEWDGPVVGDIRAAKAAVRPTYIAGDTLIAPRTLEALVAKGWLEVRVVSMTPAGKSVLQDFTGSQLEFVIPGMTQGSDEAVD